MEQLTDFRNFLFALWNARGWTPSEIQYNAADFLQQPGTHKIFSAMRGFGKTELTAALALYHGYHNPNIKILIQSASQDSSANIVRLMRSAIDEVPFLQHMTPKRNDIDGAERFNFGHREEFSKDLSVQARGVGSQVTGLHPDLIIPDDIETPENGMTAQGRERLMMKVGEYEDLLNPGGQIVMLGTPQTEDSIYFALAKHYDMIRIPARYPDPAAEESMMYLADFLREDLSQNPNLVGEPTNPVRFGSEYLMLKEAKQGRKRFALQMLLDPSLANADRYPLKLSDFIVFDIMPDICPKNIVWGTSNPREDISCPSVITKERYYAPIFHSEEWVPFDKTIMTVDQSGRGADESTACVAKRGGDKIYVCELFASLRSASNDEFIVELANLVKKWNVDEIIVESNFGGETLAALYASKIAAILGKPIKCTDENYGQMQKERRIIETCEPLMNQHRVVVDPRVARDLVFMHQLCRLTHDKGSLEHDDRIDVFFQALYNLADVAIININKTLEEDYVKGVLEAAKEFEVSDGNKGFISNDFQRFVSDWGTGNNSFLDMP